MITVDLMIWEREVLCCFIFSVFHQPTDLVGTMKAFAVGFYIVWFFL